MQFETPLRTFTTLELGGPASHFVTANTDEAIVDAVREGRSLGLTIYPLGGGSNIIVSDRGVRGLVLSIETTGIELVPDREHVLVRAKAGECWHDLVETCVERGLAGLECLGGIPGKVGATPIQNVGAYGQEVSETIVSVLTLDQTSLETRQFTSEELQFSYRDSFLKRMSGRYIVLEVTFRLARNGSPKVAYAELEKALGEESPSLRKVFDTVVALRAKKSMVLSKTDENRRSCGSFFVNVIAEQEDAERIERAAGVFPPTFPAANGKLKIPAAWLIERAGFLRGHRDGPVGLSTKHTLCLVAHEGATTRELLEFSDKIASSVQAQFGVRLEREPILWGEP